MKLRSVDTLAKAAGFVLVTLGDGNNLHKLIEGAGMKHTRANGGDVWQRFNDDGGFTIVYYVGSLAYGPPNSDGWCARRYDRDEKEIRGAVSMTLDEALTAEPVECVS